MDSIELILYNYLNSFFNNEAEKFLFNNNKLSKIYNLESEDWKSAENKFKQLFPYQNSYLDKLHIRLYESASTVIKELFNTVDSTTFVFSVTEHPTINNCFEMLKNKEILHYDTIQNLDVDLLINKIKNSGCSKVFIYLTGIVETHVLPQEFCIRLKQALIDINIPHIIILDDVQGMFIIPRDYSLFDYIIYTCHSLVPNFDCGILLTRDSNYSGCVNAEVIERYLLSLNLVLSKLNKFNTLIGLIKQYLIEELNSGYFNIPNDSMPIILYLNLDESSKKIFARYKNTLEEYKIEIGDRAIQIKMNFLLLNPSEKIIEGLKILKEGLQKSIKFKNRFE